MAFVRPTLRELVDRIEGDFKSGLNLLTIIRRSFLFVLARVLAGISNSFFNYLRYIEDQAFYDTSNEENLLRQAGYWGVQRNAATFGQYTVTVTGTIGSTIPVNRIFKRADGKQYQLMAELTFSSGTHNVDVLAVESGTASELFTADVISLLVPISNVNSNATVVTAVIEPEDLESIESLRARFLEVVRQRPSGGAAYDYIAWALSVPGVTRAWVSPQGLGPGTVVVYFVQDSEDPITPSPAKITEVFDYIETVRPATANVTVVAPTLLPINMVIQLKQNNASVQAAVTTELNDLIYRDGALVGAYKAPGVLHTGVILLSRIREAISIAVGEEDNNIVSINGIAPANVVPTTGQLPVLGVITWQTLA